MPAQRSVLVPFVWTAFGIARRDRTPKHHAVFETVPMLVPELEADGSVDISHGTRRILLPIVDGRVARPCPLDDDKDWSETSDFLDASNADEFVSRRIPDGPSLEPVRLREAPIPVEDMRPDGSFHRAADMRSVVSSDREIRLGEAVEAGRNLALVDGRLCVFGDGPLFPVTIRKDVGPTVFGIGEPIFLRSALHEAGRGMRQGRNWSSHAMHLRPDEVLALAAGGADVRSESPSATLGKILRIEGDVATARWTADSSAVSFADAMSCVYSAFSDMDERWNRTGFAVREAVLGGSHAAMRIVVGMPPAGDLRDVASRVASAISALPTERRSPGSSGSLARLAEYALLAASCGWNEEASEPDPDAAVWRDVGI